MADSPKIEVARIYDALIEGGRSSGDEAHANTVRVLVDRLWPRGVSKEHAAIDLWPKDATPSSELRKSWHADPRGHEPDRFQAFEQSYREELAQDPAKTAFAELVDELSDAKTVLLLTASKTPEVSHVPVIAAALRKALG